MRSKNYYVCTYIQTLVADGLWMLWCVFFFSCYVLCSHDNRAANQQGHFVQLRQLDSTTTACNTETHIQRQMGTNIKLQGEEVKEIWQSVIEDTLSEI